MVFAAYVLENEILLFSPGVAFARFFKAPPWGFCMNRPARGGGAEISAALPKKNDKCPIDLIDARRMGTFGIDWAIITSYYGTSHYPGDYLDYYTIV